MSGDFYVPEDAQIQPQSGRNKQGRKGKFSLKTSKHVEIHIKNISEKAHRIYKNFLNLDIDVEEADYKPVGLSRELARIILPLSTYTEMYWKMDLHNLLHFILLRTDPKAQYEIRVYAEKLLEIVEKWVPETYQAFMDYKKNASTFSEVEVEIIQDLIGKQSMGKPKMLSDREWKSFVKKIDLFVEHGEEDE
jgi:thymidylate synthase (FAD)